MRAWDLISPSELNLSCVPLMGGAAGLGLGLAIARPSQRVIVLDGDGSLLMELGVLATVAQAEPQNYYHFVFNNGVWFEGGANLPVPSAKRVRFADMARAAGYASAHVVPDAESLEDCLDDVFGGPGPVLIELQIDPLRGERDLWGRRNPQPEIPDAHFEKMGLEARVMRRALSSGES